METTIHIEELKDSELIIEAVFEDPKLTVDLFKRLGNMSMQGDWGRRRNRASFPIEIF